MPMYIGPEHASREKKCTMVSFLIFVHKNVYRIRFQEVKIRSLEGFEKIKFFSLFLMRKLLSTGQKQFLRLNFPLIRGIHVCVQKWSQIFVSGTFSSGARQPIPIAFYGRLSQKKLLFFWILSKLLSPPPLPPIWTTCTTFFNTRNVDLSHIQNDSLSEILL